MEKRCTKCGERKALEAFNRNKNRRKDGRENVCRICNNKRIREWKRLSGYYKSDRVKDSRVKFNAQNRHKKNAQNTLNKAVYRGRIQRPSQCSQCHHVSEQPIEAHHADYGKPLEVEWLCKTCHSALHAEENAAQQAPPAPITYVQAAFL